MHTEATALRARERRRIAHAVDGMVEVVSTRFSNDCCTKQPKFNFEGSKTVAYCRRHTDNGMLNVPTKRCIHKSCLARPGWFLLTEGGAPACLRHRGDLLGGPVIDFTAKCRVAGCTSVSRWGVEKGAVHPLPRSRPPHGCARIYGRKGSQQDQESYPTRLRGMRPLISRSIRVLVFRAF